MENMENMEKRKAGNRFMTMEFLEKELTQSKVRFFTAMPQAAGKCIGILETGRTDNQIGIFTGDLKDENQEFVFLPVDEEYFAIRSCKNGQVMDICGAKGNKGDIIILHPFHGGDNQLWKLKPLKNGNFMIGSKMNKLALDVSGGISKDGTPLIAWERHAGSNQQFCLTMNNNTIMAGAVACNFVTDTDETQAKDYSGKGAPPLNDMIRNMNDGFSL